jgi:hypothetical protein
MRMRNSMQKPLAAETGTQIQTTAPGQPANVSKDFLPVYGYDAPDFSATLVLSLLQHEHRLSHERLAKISLTEVRVMFQVCATVPQYVVGNASPEKK